MSTQPSPRAEQRAATRAQLKEAAARRIAERGLDGASIGGITRSAGVAHGTFYVHFQSKDALLDELVADLVAGQLAALAPIWALTGPLAGRVRRAAELFLDYWAQERALIAVAAQRLGAAGLSGTLQEGVSPPMTAALAGRLGALVGASPLLVQALLAAWARVGLQHLFGRNVTRQEAVDVLVRLTLGALDRAPDAEALP